MSGCDETVHLQRQLAVRVAELVRDLQLRPPAEMDEAFDQLVKEAANSVPGAEHSGITIARRRREIETACATGPYPRLLDQVQQRHREGPCLSAAWDQHMIRIDDLSSDHRWPHYRREALAQTPIRSIISFRLFGDSQNVGALNFYAEQSNAFDDESMEVGLLFATHTALAWNTLRRDRQFRSALASRDVIGQAKGILMERFKIDAMAAFGLLTRLSQESNVPVAQIARQLVEAD
jgi:GAF domain-containing protein